MKRINSQSLSLLLMCITAPLSLYPTQTQKEATFKQEARPMKSKKIAHEIKKEVHYIAKQVALVLCREMELESQLDQCCTTLNSKLDTCCADISCSNISAIEQLIHSCCSSLNSKIDLLDACSAIEISTPTTISIPGNYCLSQSITSSNTIITIAGPHASNIYLDLNGHSLNAVNGISAITINESVASSNIEIFNGSIAGFGQAINGIDIVSSTSAVICDLRLRNLSIHDFVGLGFAVESPVSKLLIENCTFCSNGGHASINNSTDISIIQSTLSGSTQDDGVFFNNSQNILIRNSLFNHNAASGIDAVNVNGLLIENCLANDNATGGDGSGLSLRFCNAFTAKSCMFDNTNTATPSQALGLIIVGSCSKLIFESCSFSSNINGGIFIEALEQTPAFSLKFFNCIINQNQKSGVIIIGNALDTVFDHCYACGNAAGFRTEGIFLAGTQNFVTPSIDIINSVAKDNKFEGFSLFGSGIIKENLAINNGTNVPNGCGFDDLAFSLSNFTYVANMAKNNGPNPANILGNNQDTNYCNAGAPSTLTANGPGSFPFNQVKLGLPPRSYWDNITAQ